MATDDHATAHASALARLGLTGYEARAYLALVGAASLTAADVARAASVPRQRIYDVLAGLRAAGLVVAGSGKLVRYEAAPPEIAVERLLMPLREEMARNERDAASLVTELAERYESARGERAATCAAVILAAGAASRFGGGKLLAPLDGRPLLQHTLDLVADVGLDPVVVVLGADAPRLRQACAWRNEVIVVNGDAVAGISGSVKLGLAQLALSTASRALVLLADQPRLSSTQLRTIMAAPPDDARPIVVPRYSGEPGNPVLLERAAWPMATKLQGDMGMAQLFAARQTLVRYVNVDGTNPDVDTTADLAALGSAAPEN